MSGFLRTVADYVVTLVIVFAAIILGEALPFMRRLDAAIAASRPAYLTPAIVLLVVGWGGFLAAIIYGAVSGRGSFGVEVSFVEIKRAWRRQLWRTDRAWRVTFLMMAAAWWKQYPVDTGEQRQ